MTPGRTNGSASDTSLDREIEAILSVEPSPEFVSRVRTRIGDAPVPGWITVWTSLAAGTVVVAVVVAVVISKPHEPYEISQQQAAGTSATRPIRVDIPSNDAPVSPNLNSVKPPERRKPRVSKAVFHEPQMLINPEEAAAIRRFLASPQPERVELSLMPVEPQPLPEFTFTPLPTFDSVAVMQGDFK